MKNTRFLLAFVFLAAAALFAGAPAAHAQDTTDAEAPPPPPAEEAMPAEQDVVSLLAADGSFTVLVDALERTGLAETLQSEGPFTLFAPTDEAFGALPAGTLDSLSTEQLAEVLRYHVVPGMIGAEDAVAAGSAATVQGGEVMIAEGENGVTVNDASVVTADVEASNGVIHVVDTVLMPSAMGGAGEDGR